MSAREEHWPWAALAVFCVACIAYGLVRVSYDVGYDKGAFAERFKCMQQGR